ncbi:hypothetical protein, conserved [Trypanosoma brucei gambiense DAL972]|uniref:Uncharacterized protein n=2 Tax=Trypanosoma brucei TaxID=5691 RepID=C9ZNY2_TRYB9|nr:hypothetical protein, conserved [Trypanosoma brucei gambiense DAL972]RHW72383.1 hypothetical protein DPX39_050023600 [Trypanosoma brucei equiperdum]CBH11110.1 hypothetical protein, conserved [Trypanosoma brucei gambiense DAL972]|eukprot:XP_011773397.1 hypothetical protein, conserved [Trypanosoma brucei gambiense DAL972]
MSSVGIEWSALSLPVEGEVVFASFVSLICPLNGRREGDDVSKKCSAASVLCNECANAIVCVLKGREVAFFDLADESAGPREVRRIGATPPLLVSRFMRNADPSVATCATLLPKDVSFMCRVPPAAVERVSSSDPSAGPHDGGAGAAHSVRGTVYLCGAVGTSDGRVDVFSEEGYVFGFVASDGPVVAVSVIYSTSFSSGGCAGVKSWEQIQPSGVSLPAEGSDEERTLDRATANLGFVTTNADGVVSVWRQDGCGLKPAVFGSSALFSRVFCSRVVQPSSRDWLLSGTEVTRTPFIVHTSPGLTADLCARSAVTFEDVESRVRLPGNMLTRTTAIASDGDSALVARGRSVFHVTFSGSSCDLVCTADCNVDGLHLPGSGPQKEGGAALAAACDVKGTVYVLCGQPLSVLGRYSATGGGPIRSLSICAVSRLVTIVGGDGTVDVVLVPTDADSVPTATVHQALASLPR